ncbi:cytochrome c oxidase subunit VIa [Ascoidea rubescens DSM 1968]|uniref:Cytochrome c oxidase subunit n=1 Tax=Ascoidea rubescens DSM 1968 TaxID=1344418 RepID=A0A1D2VB04_9ASCO|nr:cytochrome c oxidase, subunit VIa [Ascoidea rubescens DSM 1968]ODV58884.1 cytochrome c oxidase, subunit VIa [Ascoidea rubescens DSM 1968]
MFSVSQSSKKAAASASRQIVRYNSTIPKWAYEQMLKPDKKIAKEFSDSLRATEDHAGKTSDLWMKITWFVAVPALIAATVNTYFVEKEHFHHIAEKAKIPDEEWPQQYEYQNIRSKPFFWGDGDKTFFWNDKINRNVKRE